MLLADEVVFLDEVCCRRLRCAGGCGRRWTVRPAGLLPRRHYQACVVAQATSQYLLGADASRQQVAAAHRCSRRTLGRWLDYLGVLVAPAELERQVCAASEAPLLVETPVVPALARKARSTAGRTRLVLAALCLVLFEALAAALRLPPPGLGTLLQLVIADTDRVTTYQRPAIPDFARRLAGTVLAFRGCEP